MSQYIIPEAWRMECIRLSRKLSSPSADEWIIKKLQRFLVNIRNAIYLFRAGKRLIKSQSGNWHIVSKETTREDIEKYEKGIES